MIEVITAKNCGFCFGVRKAVDALLGEIESGQKNNTRVYLFGKIIHNNYFLNGLSEKNVVIIDDARIDCVYKELKQTENKAGLPDYFEFEENSAVIIRAHGIPKIIFEYLLGIQKQKNLRIIDATCECVNKMHIIAEKNTAENTFTIIFGDKNHPEIIALDSYVNGNRQIIKDFEELKSDFKLNKKFKKLIILAQTTHNIKDYMKCKDFIKEKCAVTT